VLNSILQRLARQTSVQSKILNQSWQFGVFEVSLNTEKQFDKGEKGE